MPLSLPPAPWLEESFNYNWRQWLNELRNFVVSPGSVVQIVNVQDGELSSGTTVLPKDNTIPQNTEGNEVMTLTVTPVSAANQLKNDVVVNGSFSAALGTNMMAALFQDTTADALASGMSAKFSTTDDEACVVFTHFMTAGTDAETTFKVRWGNDNAGTSYFNGAAGGTRLHGGVLASSITITEIRT